MGAGGRRRRRGGPGRRRPRGGGARSGRWRRAGVDVAGAGRRAGVAGRARAGGVAAGGRDPRCGARRRRRGDRPGRVRRCGVWCGPRRPRTRTGSCCWTSMPAAERGPAPGHGAGLRRAAARRARHDLVTSRGSPASQTPAEPAVFSPEGTVLVSGAGSLGALAARRLVTRHGVRRLVLASRRGRDADGVAELVADLTGQGAEVSVVACDVSDRDQVAALLAEHRPTGRGAHGGRVRRRRDRDADPGRAGEGVRAQGRRGAPPRRADP